MPFDVNRYIGDALEFAGTYYVAGVETSLASHTIRSTLKLSTAHDVADPGVAQISTVSSASGVITLTTGAGGVANAGYLCHFNSAATALLTANDDGIGPILYLDVRLVQADGDPFVIDPKAGTERNVIRLFGPVTLTKI